jgi:hypothetical protein
MTNLTAREILDAIDRGLKAAAQQFEKGRPDQKERPDQSNAHPPPEPPPDKALEPTSQDERR